MSAISRGLRNVWRRPVRTALVVLILAVTIGVFITMTIVDAGVTNRINDLESEIGTTISVAPAGESGGFSLRWGTGPTYLDANLTADLEAIDHVTSVEGVLSGIYHFESANVTSGQWGGGGFQRPPIIFVVGISPTMTMEIPNIGPATLVQGEGLGGYTMDDPVTLVGKGYSENESVALGDTVTLADTDLLVIGIHTTGTFFGDRSFIMPLPAAQAILNASGNLSSILVGVDNIANAEAVGVEMRALLGEDSDVTVPEDANAATVAALEDIAGNSLVGAVSALILGSVVVMFVMILVTRERRREIGTLKAIGASAGNILGTFLVEVLTIAAIAAVVGLLVASAGGALIAEVIIEDSPDPTTADDQTITVTDQTQDHQGGQRPGGFGGFGGQQHFGGSGTGFVDVGAQEPTDLLGTVTYGFSVRSLSWAFSAAAILGLLGTLYPAIQAIRMTPAEALRND